MLLEQARTLQDSRETTRQPEGDTEPESSKQASKRAKSDMSGLLLSIKSKKKRRQHSDVSRKQQRGRARQDQMRRTDDYRTMDAFGQWAQGQDSSEVLALLEQLRVDVSHPRKTQCHSRSLNHSQLSSESRAPLHPEPGQHPLHPPEETMRSAPSLPAQRMLLMSAASVLVDLWRSSHGRTTTHRQLSAPF
ncbi:hypothetical protein ABVT39_018697 [Epinephelus coioides]